MSAGRLSFNLLPPEDYLGPVVVIAALRLGDHAHLEIMTGHQRINGNNEAQINYGKAGHLIMSWDAWLWWRDQLALNPWARIAETDCPTRSQLDHHLAGSPE